ncbi:hypothetical protein [Thalassobaculum salexigens]|uniref:hypothetical protein n=1 Tax=Thalassobaculum salexigens TaxID=455360 RepID=UPI00248E8928|nr:hypothetical protein [Thalassobaculum salexigens]
MDMHFSQQDGAETEGQTAGRGAFGYLFEDAARSPDCLLPACDRTVNGLLDLGAAMGDPGTRADAETRTDGTLPAVMTYFARFIAHDLTARIDRKAGPTPLPDGAIPEGAAPDCARDVAAGSVLAPMAPDLLVRRIVNGRRPQFDLASLYGDGPGLGAALGCPDRIGASSDQLYDGLRLKVRFDRDGRLDLPRHVDGVLAGRAIVGDGRNDGCLNLSQFHAAMLRFNNVVFESTHGCSTQSRWSQTRRLVRWAYQYLVVNAFLPAVCDAEVLADVTANGPRFFRPSGGAAAMPLEFALGALPFADSMVRPAYTVNDGLTLTLDEAQDPPGRLVGPDHRLKPEAVICWRNYVDLAEAGIPGPQRARPIGPRLTRGLGGRTDAVRAMTGRAQRRLLQGYLSSLPTGQAVARRLGLVPMSTEQVAGDDPVLARAVAAGGFADRTPLWFYVLREAAALSGGRTLGPVGSRLLADVVLGLLRADPNSYLNHQGNRAVTARGIEITSGLSATMIGSLADVVRYAGLRR